MTLQLPSAATAPLVRFMAHHLQMAEFKAFVLRVSIFVQEHFDKLEEAITDADKASKRTRSFAEVLGEGRRSFYTFEQHELIISEMIVTRIVDNFLVYLKELLVLIYRSRPETLRSGEHERLDFILQHSTMEELVTAVAQKRVEEASFKGMRELAEHFDRLGLQLFASQEVMDQAVRIVELRNLIVHNRGVVNSIFKRRVPDHPAEIGQHIHLNYGTADEFEKLLANSASDVDVRAAEKFGLARATGLWTTPEADSRPGAE